MITNLLMIITTGLRYFRLKVKRKNMFSSSPPTPLIVRLRETEVREREMEMLIDDIEIDRLEVVSTLVLHKI